MQFKISLVDKHHADCLVVFFNAANQFARLSDQLIQANKKALLRLLEQGRATEDKSGQMLLLHETASLSAKRLLLVNTGKAQHELTDKEYINLLAQIAKRITSEINAQEIVLPLTDLVLKNHDIEWQITKAVEILSFYNYQYSLKTKQKPSRDTLRKSVFLIANTQQMEVAKKALQQGLAIAEGMRLTKNLANAPANYCTPTFLAKEAQILATEYKAMTAKIFDYSALKRLKMGAFLAVAQGSDEPPTLITLNYQGADKKTSPIVLIGKGITFDSGGLSLKPATSMMDMKYDMSGAATVLGTLKAIAELKLPINVVAIIPCTENLINGRALKPGDIITSLSGQTIEVLNTDAEGRLILCDAITYSERFKPAVVIDIATLTGAILIALGTQITGLFSNNSDLAKDLEKASVESGDKLWRMPLDDDYQEQLKTRYADVCNIGGPFAGSITAACFLSRFAKKLNWAHLDIAGTAVHGNGIDKVATGRPVPLLVRYLINYSKTLP